MAERITDGPVLEYLSPSSGMPYNQAEALGSAIWLWMHSKRHQQVTVAELTGLLLPAITRGQFVLATEGGKPVFYSSFAYFDAERERLFIDNPQRLLANEDWHSGDRYWVIDWVAPFGHSLRALEALRRELMPEVCVRALSRPKKDGSVAVYQITGRRVDRQRARDYFDDRPLLQRQSV